MGILILPCPDQKIYPFKICHWSICTKQSKCMHVHIYIYTHVNNPFLSCSCSYALWRPGQYWRGLGDGGGHIIISQCNHKPQVGTGNEPILPIYTFLWSLSIVVKFCFIDQWWPDPWLEPTPAKSRKNEMKLKQQKPDNQTLGLEPRDQRSPQPHDFPHLPISLLTRLAPRCVKDKDNTKKKTSAKTKTR